MTRQYIDYFDNPAGVVQGAIGSALAAGSVVGSVAAGPLSDRYGRRDSTMLACVFWLVGTAVQVSAAGRGQLIAGRVLNGFTVGVTSSQVPVYLAEIARAERRGSVVIVQQLAIEVGILVMYFVGFGCSFIPGPASFRTAWAIQFVPCVLLLCGLPFLPRSPRWLAKVGRETEAMQTLAHIQAGGDVNDPLVIAEWEEIVTTMQAELEAGRGWRKFVKNGMWKRTLAGMSVQAWQVSQRALPSSSYDPRARIISDVSFPNSNWPVRTSSSITSLISPRWRVSQATSASSPRASSTQSSSSSPASCSSSSTRPAGAGC